MPAHDIMVVGTSAGGVEALKIVVGGLPRDLPAALFIVLHLLPQRRSVLAQLLSRAGPLPATQAVSGEAITRGHIYVAPPDHHLRVEPGHVRCTHGPEEHRCRPAVDVLFRSAADAYGPRVVGVVLTGMLDDGTAGLRAIKDHGGVAIVQAPQEALYASMPWNALQRVAIDYCLPLAELAPALVGLSAKPPPRKEGFPSRHRPLHEAYQRHHPRVEAGDAPCPLS
jgi:two-component system chemotaxis response regulator CheB